MKLYAAIIMPQLLKDSQEAQRKKPQVRTSKKISLKEPKCKNRGSRSEKGADARRNKKTQARTLIGASIELGEVRSGEAQRKKPQARTFCT